MSKQKDGRGVHKVESILDDCFGPGGGRESRTRRIRTSGDEKLL